MLSIDAANPDWALYKCFISIAQHEFYSVPVAVRHTSCCLNQPRTAWPSLHPNSHSSLSGIIGVKAAFRSDVIALPTSGSV